VRRGRSLWAMDSPSLPLRMLLNTDGSVTALLEASFAAPIVVETRTNTVDHGRPRSLRRTAILRNAATGRPLLRASSELALDRLPPIARTALLEGSAPIGAVLREARLETRREILARATDTATADDAAELGVDEGSPVYERTYQIVSYSRPLAVVTERMPASLFEEAA
jgi:chorismate-pyruvate lyase